MQKSNEDCFYFLTSSCAKGSGCTYRHNSVVLTCNVICPSWLRGNCTDSACSLRHSTVQRPTIINNGISCFYENTPMGCLKLDCTFVHSRPRPTVRNPSTLRSSATNLVNKDAIKSTAITNPSSTPSSILQTTNDSISSPQIDSSQSSIPKVEILLTSTEIPSSTIPNETIPRRVAVPIENEQTETTNRNVITDSTEKNQEDTKTTITTTTTTTQSRVVGNRNVVIAESANTSNRKIVQGTTNRLVVSSDTINSSKRITNDNDSDSDIDLDDLVKQPENDNKKTNSVIDIPFPCSAPSITNRLFMSAKQTTPTNDTKPIRLKRDRLPATKITITNSPNSISTSSNGEKTSAGTELSQDDERRTSRIERFKKKSISSPRSVANTSSSSPTTTTTTVAVPNRNIVTPSTNERKRPGPESSVNDSPPSKRLSSQQENNHYHNAATTTTIGDLCSPSSNSRRTYDRYHHRHRSSSSSSSSSQRKSSPRSTYPLTSSMDDSTWKKEVDEFLAKTTQPKNFLPSITMPCQPVSLLSLRPRYIPPPLLPQQQQQKPMIPRQPPPSQRPRQPSSVAYKQSAPPVVNNFSPVPSKPTEQIPSKPTEQIPLKPTEQIPPNNNNPPVQSPTILKEEEDEEDKLLEPDGSTDVVDTFAFIDEALFDADHLLELM
ncbi:unnamed protein product [Rotaria sp. Silwood2]|nr:unnamed protein product [Rotaria sp. Silwood2]